MDPQDAKRAEIYQGVEELLDGWRPDTEDVTVHLSKMEDVGDGATLVDTLTVRRARNTQAI